MNVDAILTGMNKAGVDYLLIGGMNFLLNHAPLLTFDVDLWIRDTAANRNCVNEALRQLQAEWGPNEQSWTAIPVDSAWLERQVVFCITSPHGPIDIFRRVRGLEDDYEGCIQRALARTTGTGVPYRGLSDEDMLRCQLALPQSEQKLERVRILTEVLRKKGGQP